MRKLRPVNRVKRVPFYGEQPGLGRRLPGALLQKKFDRLIRSASLEQTALICEVMAAAWTQGYDRAVKECVRAGAVAPVIGPKPRRVRK